MSWKTVAVGTLIGSGVGLVLGVVGFLVTAVSVWFITLLAIPPLLVIFTDIAEELGIR